MDSNKSLNKALISIHIERFEKESPMYNNEDMVVFIDIGHLTVNWHPVTINRVLKFFRYYKLISLVIQEEKELLERQQYNQEIV